MFIDGNSQKRPDDFSGFEKINEKSSKEKRDYSFYFIYLLIILLFIIFAYFFLFLKKDPQSGENGSKNPQSTSSSPHQGFGFLNPDDNQNGSDDDFFSNLKAEDLIFGHFYEKPEIKDEFNLKDYELPINIKVDVSNYYEITRKLNLDNQIEHLNNYGFAVINNPFPEDANDFFAMNKVLSRKEIPIVVSSDHILYYYQNTLKEVYKDIQKESFYKNVWDIAKNLYEAALLRYRQKRIEIGDVAVNDPVLEAARLELAFFATMRKILSPMEDQIYKEESAGLKNLNKFSEMEADFYSFNLPVFLEDDVSRELEYIREAEGEKKSPVMLYFKNYADFRVPNDYLEDAKLNNFYLAMRWMNSNFPLYYRSEDCPNCLLDKNDWIINFIAANFIAEDLRNDQKTKNQWAIVYKFISFFSGLRSDLTYLHYNSSTLDLFGEDFSVESTFSSENPERDENIEEMIKRIEDSYDFKEIEGAYSRTNPDHKPYLGMRILQKAYWPNDYIFDNLTGEDMVYQFEEEERKRITNPISCRLSEFRNFYRCKISGFDIINLINPINNNSNFEESSNYLNYEEKSKKIKKEINTFDNFTKNDNIYWLTLDVVSNLYPKNMVVDPTYSRDDKWISARSENSALGAWLNLHLEPDLLSNYVENSNVALGGRTVCNQYNYLEPNVVFISEIIARNEMLINMLENLNVSKTANNTTISLKEFNDKIKTLFDIAKKELNNENLSEEECKFLDNFAKHKTVENKGAKIIAESEQMPNQSIQGLKLVIIVHEKDDRLVMSMGPIFNYQEY